MAMARFHDNWEIQSKFISFNKRQYYYFVVHNQIFGIQYAGYEFQEK